MWSKEELEKRYKDLGYPLDENGNVDWEKLSEEKQVVLDQHERRLRLESGMSAKPKRKHARNYTPPKRRHRK